VDRVLRNLGLGCSCPQQMITEGRRSIIHPLVQ
jgi:hypothetical protein